MITHAPAGVTDDEIIAEAFRLARSGRFRRADPLKAEVMRLFPAEPESRIRNCLGMLCKRLIDAEQ